jgi:hypothetical protein
MASAKIHSGIGYAAHLPPIYGQTKARISPDVEFIDEVRNFAVK